jgi:hypothetical protein
MEQGCKNPKSFIFNSLLYNVVCRTSGVAIHGCLAIGEFEGVPGLAGSGAAVDEEHCQEIPRKAATGKACRSGANETKRSPP